MSAKHQHLPKIEVTPAMEKAGMEELRPYDTEPDSPGEVAIRVFRAMFETYQMSILPKPPIVRE